MMHNTCKDQLRRSEEQQQLEVQERQKAELTCRNLELDMRTLANNIKQVAPLRTNSCYKLMYDLPPTMQFLSLYFPWVSTGSWRRI